MNHGTPTNVDVRVSESGGTRSAARRDRHAFTLLEILVAIGVVALVSVGLAAIFDSVGKTVSAGRRTSKLTAYASLIEEQFRRDIAAMTRDGPLVIRQQFVDRNGDGFDPRRPARDAVPLTAEGGARARRIDELLFAARGEFTSSRRPIAPDMVAKSNVAMVYYGHGQKVGKGSAYYTKPDLSWTTSGARPPAEGLGIPGSRNEYAADWTLLRRPILLATPGASSTVGGLEPIPGLDRGVPANKRLLEDKAVQIAGQPAAASAFRTLATFESRNRAGVEESLRGDEAVRLDTGLVDIATTDLSELRRTILGTPFRPFDIEKMNRDRDLGGPSGLGSLARWVPDKLMRVASRPYDLGRVDVRAGTGARTTDFMHAWMDQLFPANSLSFDEFQGGNVTRADGFGERIRYESEPPSLLDQIDPNAPATGGANVPAEVRAQMAYADQVMLTSSNFIPRCTEFIVEWSFGKVNDFGQVIWHGPEQGATGLPGSAPYPPLPIYGAQLDTRTTIAPPNAGAQANRDYGLIVSVYPTQQPIEEYVEFDFARYATDRGRVVVGPDGNPIVEAIERRRHPITDRVIYGSAANAQLAAVVGVGVPLPTPSLTSYFGFVDPTWDPTDPFPKDANLGLAGLPGRAIGLDTVPCPWPRMLRITVSIADPSQPLQEETFQFVYELPERTAR